MKNVTELTYPKIDILSIILSSFGFGGLLYGFTSAGNNGWTDLLTIITLGIGIISLCLFVLRQMRMNHPMLEFRVFKSFIFTLTTILGMIGFMGLIGVETLIPLYMQNMRDFTAMEAGLALLPGALVMGFMSPITGRIFDRIGARWLVITGLVIITFSTLAFSNLNPTTSFAYITIMYSVRMFGLSMVMMPATTAGLNQLPKRLLAHGAAMSNTMRQIAASIGTALIVTVMTTTAQHASQQAKALNPLIHGINVAFIVITILSLIGVILAFFIKKVQPSVEEKWNKQLDENKNIGSGAST
jgi:EmrB/QacA subfamily drug resistance transporter